MLIGCVTTQRQPRDGCYDKGEANDQRMNAGKGHEAMTPIITIQRSNDPIPGWKPTESVAFILDDKSADDRTSEQLQALVDDLRTAANKHNFDLQSWGTQTNIRKFLLAFC